MKHGSKQKRTLVLKFDTLRMLEAKVLAHMSDDATQSWFSGCPACTLIPGA
jgi:hypothetical protein